MPSVHHSPRQRDESLLVAFLGSGSSGNATVVSVAGASVLIDVGFSARETLCRLERTSVDAGSIRAIVLTHEHTDHIRGVRVLAKRLGVPVYASRGTFAASGADRELDQPRTLCAGDEVCIGPLSVRAFPLSHDAVEPIGLRIETPAGAVGLATDTGELMRETAEELAGCRVLGIECNHDVEMLQAGPYPLYLKQRILSGEGHLSNDDAGAALEFLAHENLHTVVGLHLSRTNNAPDVALAALRCVTERKRASCEVRCATHDDVCVVHVPVG